MLLWRERLRVLSDLWWILLWLLLKKRSLLSSPLKFLCKFFLFYSSLFLLFHALLAQFHLFFFLFCGFLHFLLCLLPLFYLAFVYLLLEI